MSEDVTYSTLTLQDSAGTGNCQDRNNFRTKDSSVSPTNWRQAALGLLALCLLLLIGLVTMGILYFQTENKVNSGSEKLTQLLQVIEQQRANSSRQQTTTRDLLEKEKSLKSQISELLRWQKKIATKLCQELVTHTSDHKCNPCPKTWHWYQDSCYYFVTTEEKNWDNSRDDCVGKESSLVKIETQEEKDYLKSRPLPKYSFFWLGLSLDPSTSTWLWEDGSIPSPSIFNAADYGSTDETQRCAYFQNGKIFISRCSAEISWICEQTAPLVKPENLD
ncbi:C-type lectin domain family 12 member B isoform X2 [Sorex araneus]|uniref:C-type lectin domain family 12 member B isoform X2 n=1 Tax=Sorex araneus TaxID=42254 RepID=UPI002433AF97|nr:C-type lectin domain family 12 member B isoform X2 [Sorex araneus]